MNTRLEKLTAKVAAVNRANEYAAKLSSILHESFAPLVGQQILKVNGSLLAKYADLLPKQNTHDLLVYRLSSPYSLAWVVKTCESMAESCVYHQTTVYVGNLDGKVLSNLVEFEDRRSDYTVDEILEKVSAHDAAKRLVDNLRGELYPFDTND